MCPPARLTFLTFPMTSHSTPKFTVAIWYALSEFISKLISCSGAGPGGLALAASIARFNDPAAPVAVDLYEAQPEIGTIGAGITVWPRTRALFEDTGIMASLKGEVGTMETQEDPDQLKYGT